MPVERGGGPENAAASAGGPGGAGGRMTATQAALELGVSRKTYYAWQERALSAMRSPADRPAAGRRSRATRRRRRSGGTVRALEQERAVLASRLRIQEAIRETFAELQQGTRPPKKKRGWVSR